MNRATRVLSVGALLALSSLGVPRRATAEDLVLGGIAEGNLTGTVWVDRNSDRQRDPDEPGLAGVLIYSDLNNNGVFDRGEPMSESLEDDPATRGDETGRYRLALEPGRHIIREVVPDGFEQTFPEDGAQGPGAHLVPVEAGATLDGVDFGVRKNDPGSIHGTKWLDENGNAERDPDEPGLPGVIIYVDLNDNGEFDDNEPRTRTMEDDPDTAFDESGLYWLEGIEPGRHVVREVVPDGFVQTFPLPAGEQGGSHILVIEAGQVLEGVDFGNRREGGSSIHGTKWLDENGNGERERDEPGLAGVLIYSDLNFNGALDDDEPRTRTMADDPNTAFDESGMYWLEGIEPGRHVVREVVPDGFVQTFPAPAGELGGSHPVIVEPGQAIEGIDFGNRREGGSSVHGTKWLDENGNAERDADEPGLPGVVIYSDLNSNGVLDEGEPHTASMEDDPNTAFDESGHYWLEGLEPGRHVVREVVPEGFIQTYPTGPVLDPAPPAENGFFDVTPESIVLDLADDESAVREVSLTVQPFCFRAYDVDVVAPAAPTGMVENLTGVLVNGCGGDESEFSIRFNGDGNSHSFDLQFVDAEFGGVLATIPVVIGDAAPSGAYAIELGVGEIVDGVDFGNRRRPVSSIHGVKWLDENGNGQRDHDEPGLPGVLIYVDLNGNGQLNRGEPNAVTMEDVPETDFDEAGHYWLENIEPGRRIVREVVPDGFVQTFPSPSRGDGRAGGAGFSETTPSSISLSLVDGEVLEMEVSLKVLPLCVRPYTLDVVAPGAPAGLFENLTGVLVNGCGGDLSTFSVRFKGDGAPHLFALQFVDTEFGGVLDEIPVRIGVGDLGGAHIVDLGRGETVEGVDFGNRPHPVGSIHGTKWEDTNGNGRRERNEPGLPGVTIYSDRNFNGRLDEGEPRAVSMRDDPDTAVDEAGRYWLESLEPGPHSVREVVPDGFVQTFPPVFIDVGEAGGVDSFAVAPSAISLGLGAGESFEMKVSLTVTPFCVRPFEIDVVAPDAPAGMVANLTGILINGCGGDMSTFAIRFNGDGGEHVFALQFVDTDFGGVLAEIPVRIGDAGRNGGHFVIVEPDQAVDGIDFGNQRDERKGNIRPGDCNRDGALNIADPICLANFLFTGRPERLPCGEGRAADPAVVEIFDFNGDGAVNIADISAQIGFQFLGTRGHVRGRECVPAPVCPQVCDL